MISPSTSDASRSRSAFVRVSRPELEKGDEDELCARRCAEAEEYRVETCV